MTLDRILGLVCGWSVFGLLAWGIAEIWKPVVKKDRQGTLTAIAMMGAITIAKIISGRFFPGHPDFDNLVQRAALTTSVDPAQVLGRGFLDYPPGMLYCAWLYGWIAHSLPGDFRMWVRAGASLTDFVLGITIFMAVARRRRFAVAMAAMLCFALNPGLVYDSVIWGQNDTALALPMLAGALLICERRYLLGWSAAAFAMLIKPQAMAMYPPLAVATLLDTEVREWFVLGLLFVAVVAITIAPFQAGHPPRLFFDLYGTLAARYHAGSMNTLNFLALGDLNQPDAKRVPIIGISYFYFGMALLAALYAAVSIQIARARGRDNFMLTIAVTLLGWVMFAPRMHERYFFCPLVFLIAVALDSWILIAAMVWLSATFLWNLVMVYPPFGPVAHVPTTYRTLMAAFLNFVAFVAVAWVCFARSASSPAQGEQTNSLAPEASTQLGGARIL